MQNQDKNESEYVSNEQFNYFKHKNGYIYPMHYKLNCSVENMTLYVKFRANSYF